MRGLIVLLLVAGWAAQAQAQRGLVTDISDNVIEIRYSFAGADLLLFGAISRPEGAEPMGAVDVVVVVRGPTAPFVVRRKERVLGIWVNTDAISFVNAPGYYAVASTRPLADIAAREQLRRLELGFSFLPLAITQRATPEEYRAFRSALIRGKQRDELYLETGGSIRIVDNTLFRTDVRLPANVPVGTYTAEAFLFEGGEMLARRSFDITVDKSGFERAVYDFAHSQPLAYGIVAVIIALAAGWLAGVLGKH